MAKSRQSDLVDTLRARGLRKRVATTVADAVEGGRKRAKDPQKTVREVLADLKRASQEIEDRATGGAGQAQGGGEEGRGDAAAQRRQAQRGGEEGGADEEGEAKR